MTVELPAELADQIKQWRLQRRVITLVEEHGGVHPDGEQSDLESFDLLHDVADLLGDSDVWPVGCGRACEQNCTPGVIPLQREQDFNDGHP